MSKNSDLRPLFAGRAKVLVRITLVMFFLGFVAVGFMKFIAFIDDRNREGHCEWAEQKLAGFDSQIQARDGDYLEILNEAVALVDAPTERACFTDTLRDNLHNELFEADLDNLLREGRRDRWGDAHADITQGLWVLHPQVLRRRPSTTWKLDEHRVQRDFQALRVYDYASSRTPGGYIRAMDLACDLEQCQDPKFSRILTRRIAYRAYRDQMIGKFSTEDARVFEEFERNYPFGQYLKMRDFYAQVDRELNMSRAPGDSFVVMPRTFSEKRGLYITELEELLLDQFRRHKQIKDRKEIAHEWVDHGHLSPWVHHRLVSVLVEEHDYANAVSIAYRKVNDAVVGAVEPSRLEQCRQTGRYYVLQMGRWSVYRFCPMVDDTTTSTNIRNYQGLSAPNTKDRHAAAPGRCCLSLD